MTILEKQQGYITFLQEENTALLRSLRSLRIRLGLSTLAVALAIGSAAWAYHTTNPDRELLALKTQEEQNWKASAITLAGKYNDSQDEVAYVKQGMQEALEKGFIQKCPPPLILK